MPTLHWVIVCNDFKIDPKGSNIIGMFDSIRSLSFPAKHPKLVVVTKWEGEVGESFNQSIDIILPNNDVYITSGDILIEIGIRYRIAQQIFESIPLPMEGTYTVDIKADGISIRQTTFDAEIVLQ